MIGTAITSISDKIGRYKIILLAAVLLSIFGLWSCFCTSFTEFLIVRFFYGVGMGISLPMTGTYLAEISVSKSRGTLLSIFCLLWAVGATIASLLGWILLEGFHWRILFFLITIPGLVALYCQLKFGKESVRYLLIKERYEESVKIINWMRDTNEKNE